MFFAKGTGETFHAAGSYQSCLLFVFQKRKMLAQPHMFAYRNQ
jgi:hypothetical protein